MDNNLLHLPTEIKRLEDFACEADWAGQTETACKARAKLRYYEEYMELHETEYMPKF